MKILVGTLTWAPEEDDRIETIRQHLESYAEVVDRGACELLVVDNASCEAARSVVKEFEKNHKGVKAVYNEENRGWNKGRNQILSAFWDGGYDAILLTDCDIVVGNKNWPSLIAKGLKASHAFMIRPSDPFDEFNNVRVTKTLNEGGVKWKIFSEWYGCANVLSRKAVELVGGLDSETFFFPWGFSDCEYGRRLKKAGLFKFLPPYPAIDGLDPQNLQEKESGYRSRLSNTKFECIAKYSPVFAAAESAVLDGSKPLFYDFRKDA